MQFTTTSRKVHILEANATGMNEKSVQFFLNLDKQRGAQNIIKNLC